MFMFLARLHKYFIHFAKLGHTFVWLNKIIENEWTSKRRGSYWLCCFFSRLFINIHHKHKYKHISMNFSIMFICRVSQISQNTKNSKCLRTICSRTRVNVREESHPLWTRIQKHTICGSTPKEVDEEDNYQSDFCRLSTFGMSAFGHANTRMDCVRLASITWHQRTPTTQQTVCVADDAMRLENCCSSQPLPVNRRTFLSFCRTDFKRIGLVVNLSPLQTHFQ